MVHPDKCKHERAPDAFHMVENAYKMLEDPEKRRIYQRIMREAKERVEIEREKENKKRLAEGKEPLPNDTFNIDVQTMCQKLFDQIEENKKYFEKVERIKKTKQTTDRHEKRNTQRKEMKQDKKEKKKRGVGAFE